LRPDCRQRRQSTGDGANDRATPNAAEAGTTTLLIDALRSVRWPDALAGHPASRFVWAAGEFDTAQAVRQWAREERGLEKHEQLVVAYWRRGMSESDFKAAK
jgi:NADPH-dependent ferric siderophore reductase